MLDTPKSLRLHIALTGRVNSGKSSLLNLVTGQDAAIVSPERGTTTDVVEKAMELTPLGPVLWLDTAGTGDDSLLGAERLRRTRSAIDRADVMAIVTAPGVWGDPEERLLAAARERRIRAIAVVNRCDTAEPAPEFLAALREKCGGIAPVTATACDLSQRDRVLAAFKAALIEAAPEEFVAPPPLLGDLVSPGAGVMLIVPIDKQAPKGRLILPQVQAIRDALDAGAAVTVVRDSEYAAALAAQRTPPGLVVCDSQVVDLMVRETPPEIPCTTFSILFARFKGDLRRLAEGAAAIPRLRDGDRVLIAEACTHHAAEDDIGRVKIPRLLAAKSGAKITCEVFSGRDYPCDPGVYRLIVHCGSCMLNRRETLRRIELAGGTPITNYGMAISCCRGVLDRVLSPFRLGGRETDA